MSQKTIPDTSRANPANPAHAMQKKPPASALMAAKLKEHARRKIRDESARRRDLAMGKQRYTEGK
jgi:hypothetical protein